MFQNNVKVLTFCRLVGIVDGHIPSAGWRFFLQLLRCIKTLQEDAWQGLMQVCHQALCLVLLLHHMKLAQKSTDKGLSLFAA